MTPLIRRLRWTGAIALLWVSAWACETATDVNPVEIQDTGQLSGFVFLDVDADGILTQNVDVPLASVRVVLGTVGGQNTLLEATTGTAGDWIMNDVPAGSYALRVDTAVLGDSLMEVGSAGSITVQYADTLQQNLGISYPKLTLAEVRAAPPGTKVFTTGFALNSRASNGDGQVHFLDTLTTTYVRATNVARLPFSFSVGDSVLLLGRTAASFGQPVLDNVSWLILAPNVLFVTPLNVTIGDAATADSGAIDAALVTLGPAEISDTSTASGSFHFWAHDATDSVEVLFRDFLTISPTPAVRPDTIIRINQLTGLLTPFDDSSGVRWRLLPRGPADVATATKGADIQVTSSVTPVSAAVNDTVEIVVTVRNLPPQGIPSGQAPVHATATGVQIADTVPAEVTFLSATTTAGSYDNVSGTWSVGDLAPNAVSDTLRISVRVDGPSGPSQNNAALVPLVKEQESGPSPNTASATLTIS